MGVQLYLLSIGGDIFPGVQIVRGKTFCDKKVHNPQQWLLGHVSWRMGWVHSACFTRNKTISCEPVLVHYVFSLGPVSSMLFLMCAAVAVKIALTWRLESFCKNQSSQGMHLKE